MEYQRKEAAGYEGKYDVDTEGNVFSLYRCGSPTGGLLKARQNRSGYLYVSLHGYANDKKELVSRLVAKTFISNPLNKDIVHHIDENKLNNSINNLTWVTHRENMNRGTKNKRISEGVGIDVRITCPDGSVKEFNSMKEASIKLFNKKSQKVAHWRFYASDKDNFSFEGYTVEIMKMKRMIKYKQTK